MHDRIEREAQSGPMHPVPPCVRIDVINPNGVCVSFFKTKTKQNKDEPTLIHGNQQNSVI